MIFESRQLPAFLFVSIFVRNLPSMKYLLVLTLLFGFLQTDGQTRKDSLYRYQRIQQGSTLPYNADWYNNKRSFNVFELSDRVLIAHCWDPYDTEGITSIELMNDLQREYASFVVVSLVDTKLLKDSSENMAVHLIKKHKINHPLVLTHNLAPLKRKAESFPSVQVIREDGMFNQEFSGVSMEEDLRAALKDLELVAQALRLKGNNLIDNDAVSATRAALTYPRDIAISKREQRAYVADPLNNRIVVIDIDGQCNEVFGTGVAGLRDGRAGASQFNYPVALTIDDEARMLYVADAFNHAVRSIDLQTKEVKTLLGTGERETKDQKWVDSTSAPINLPTGLCLAPGKLMIAMAGHDQIWEYDFMTKRARAALGNGKRLSADGERGTASFAHPHKISRDKKGNMWVLDNASSLLRKVSPEWVVTTIDMGEEVKLDHPSGVHCSDGKVYIADTRNNRIVEWDDSKEKARVIAGKGAPGSKNGGKGKDVQFDHPAAVGMMDDVLWVADCHNQSIRSVSPKKGKTRTIELQNTFRLFRNVEAFNEGDRVYLDELLVGKGNNSVYIELSLPENLKWNEDGRNESFIQQSSFNRLIASSPEKGYIEFECQGGELNANVQIQLYMTVKDENSGIVVFRPVVLVVPLVFEPGSPTAHNLQWKPFDFDPTHLTPFPWQ